MTSVPFSTPSKNLSEVPSDSVREATPEMSVYEDSAFSSPRAPTTPVVGSNVPP